MGAYAGFKFYSRKLKPTNSVLPRRVPKLVNTHHAVEVLGHEDLSGLGIAISLLGDVVRPET